MTSSLVLILVASQSATAATYDHALIIIADDLGTDKVGVYAGDVENPTETRPQTPNIDLLAGSGVRFTDAWGMPVCSPSRAALYSGSYAYRNGVGDAIRDYNSPSLASGSATIQQIASDAGLQTALFGKWHVGVHRETPRAPRAAFDRAEYPITTGFGTFAGSTGGEPRSYSNWLYVRSEGNTAMASGYSTAASTLAASATHRTTADALDWMETQVAAGERSLTVVSYNLPHDTVNASGGGSSWADAVTDCGGIASGDDTTDQRVAVECFDDALAELLVGIPDPANTLVIFLGDNGTPDSVVEGNFVNSRGKGSIFEGGIRVPLIIADGQALADTIANGGALPEGGTYNIDAGTAVSDPVGLVDVYATVVDLLDLDTGSCTVGSDCAPDSVSMESVLTGGESERTQLWSETFSTSSAGVVTGSGAVRIGDYKLIVRSSGSINTCRSYQMYDLAADRWEQTSLLDDSAYANVQGELMAALQGHADAAVGLASDWLGYDDCCRPGETWYDGRDSDCLGGSDYDQDGDGFDAADFGGEDCNDLDPLIAPGVLDYCYDGIDANCDGANDFDLDSDGYYSAVFGGSDCDDFDPSIYPDAPDAFYDGVDADCLGNSDYDSDFDSYDDADNGGDDCDDTNPMTKPGAFDRAYDGVDSDCLGDSDFDADRDGYDSIDSGGDDCNDHSRQTRPGARDAFYDGVDSNCLGDSDYDSDRDGFDSSAYGGTDCNDRVYQVRPNVVDAAGDGLDANCDGVSP